MTHVLMVSAENGALPAGKVGGIGDVVRDVPPALAQRGCRVSVITPAYGIFTQLRGAKRLGSLKVRFAGGAQAVDLYEIEGVSGNKKIRHYALDHPLFSSCGAGRIYCDDPPGRPFESDATKFALFASAVAEAINQGAFDALEILHLHDWHAAMLLVLRQYDPACRALRKLRCVYSIHNLAIQGIRPFAGTQSALHSWYPDLVYERKRVVDPTWSDCFNPVAAAIRLADAVHTVSPSYAAEILQPSDSESGIHGGERLEADLQAAHAQNRLFGILNGCEYPQTEDGEIQDWPALLQSMRSLLPLWISRSSSVASVHFSALRTLDRLDDARPPMLVTSVGRITGQKLGLMQQSTAAGKPALWAALEVLADQGLFVMVGSGDAEYEQFLCETMAVHDNFIFLRGYSDDLADALYRLGDLFFMPSLFEPCGISQMLAMRAGQPCLVHAVGGLRDTVKNGRTGFSFSGKNPQARARAMVRTLQRALTLFLDEPERWQKMRKAAAAARFSWTDSIDAYLRLLYGKE